MKKVLQITGLTVAAAVLIVLTICGGIELSSWAWAADTLKPIDTGWATLDFVTGLVLWVTGAMATLFSWTWGFLARFLWTDYIDD